MKYETDGAIISFLKHRLRAKQALHNACRWFFIVCLFCFVLGFFSFVAADQSKSNPSPTTTSPSSTPTQLRGADVDATTIKLKRQTRSSLVVVGSSAYGCLQR